LLLLAISVTAFSQNIRFEGSVTDNTGAPLEMANVMAVNVSTKAMDAYAITNDKGKFLLNLKVNSTYTVKISYLGMQNKEISVVTENTGMAQVIMLEPGGIELEGVEVVREMPVSISGDTIIYNADSFKSGTERKLEDVLKKLPGVEVNADGEVEVEGKKVSKLMVEGKDFFDGDTKLGVKNIPADAIDKVQVLRNYNEIGALKGLENNEESVAMNIKLKEGKKNFWFGDMTAGIGVGHEDSRYIANPKVFYYNPKYSVNLITNFNNIGELPLTTQDYFKFTGGFRSMMRKGGTNFNIGTNDLGISMMRNNRAKEIETQFGAANFSFNATKSWSLSGFAILSASQTEMETLSQYELLDSGSGEIRTETTQQENKLGLFKFSSSYKPSLAFQWDYDALVKVSAQDELSDIVSNRYPDASQSQSINVVKDQTPVSVNQNFSMYYTQSDKNVFALEMQHLYNYEDPFYNPDLGVNPFPDLAGADLGIVPQSRFNLVQERFIRTNKLDAKLDYYYMVTPKSNINITLGNTYSHQNFDSAIFQVLDDGTENDLNNSTSNDVTYSFNDVFLGVHYKFITGKFTFNPGFSLHSYSMNNMQSGSETKSSFGRILPDLYALYQIKKAETLTYNFAVTTDFTDISQLAENFIISNYSSLFRGNPNLENATTQVHALRYFKYNMFNFENIFGNVTYTRRTDAVKSRAFFDGINQFSTPLNSSFADETLSGNANYGRSFLKYYKASASLALNWSKYNNIRNEEAITTESITQSYTLKAATTFKNFPNVEFGYNFTVNNYGERNFYTDRPFVNLDYFFLNSFSLEGEYNFYHYTSSDRSVDNEYDFLNASLTYQKTKDSHWEYRLGVTNLLNTKSLNDDSFTQFATRTSQYVVQPRYIIFSMKYNL
jgi:hypothetical protein